MKRAFLVLGALAVVAVAVYWFGLRGSSTPSAEAQPARPVAQIGEGDTVLVVGADGMVLGAASGRSRQHLVVLPLKQRPPGKRVRGHVLEEVRVLAAAPKPLRRYLVRTSYGETGVEVETASGIEIRFGDESEASRKWKAAAAVLADPSVTLLSYVDVSAPTRPTTGGEEHELPPAS
ncbi:MAG TPA: cell division protein FtsQ/DivIB [Solirubrobacterales bacterium]|nr:cell division protein FtsQ/DivIB [Solirubrobacterales bacterium]